MRKGLILSAILLFLALMFLALTMSTPILAIIDLIGLPILYFKLRKKELNWNFKLINIGLFVFLIISLSIFGQTVEPSKKEVAVNTTTIETKDEQNTEEEPTEEPKEEETKASTPATTNEENKETSNVKPETAVSINNSSNDSSSSNSNVKSTKGNSSSGNSSGVTTNEPAPQGRTVYWTPKGKSYHYTKSCPTLARSKTINEGNSSSCPKTDPCDKCVK